MRLTITRKKPKTGQRRQIEAEDNEEDEEKKDTYDEKENEMVKSLATGSGRRKFGTMIARQSTNSKPTGLLRRISLLVTEKIIPFCIEGRTPKEQDKDEMETAQRREGKFDRQQSMEKTFIQPAKRKDH